MQDKPCSRLQSQPTSLLTEFFATDTGAFPIPGARNQAQAKELAGATGWRLSADQVDALDRESDKVNVSAQGAPFEEW